ncbi:hypothetical protein V8E36_002051 [Tilletia maclaganii]
MATTETPSHEELNQLELDLSHKLQQSEWKPSISPWERTLERSQARFRTHTVRQEVQELEAECEAARQKIKRRQAEFAARRERLLQARQLEAAETRRAEQIEKQSLVLRKKQSSLALSLHRRRVALLRSLEQIYPIELTDPTNFLFSIAEIPLPNGTSGPAADEGSHRQSKGKEKAVLDMEPEKTLKNQDPEITAAALGLVAQLVTLLSAYLETPVHYPLATAGSRSVVQDAISVMNGPRAFPLYSKGVEEYRFEYAVYLLNKDIEQLVNEHHVPLIDLQQTLPNLKNLMNTIISANTPKAYTSHTSRRLVSAREIALNTSSPPRSIVQLQPHHSPSGPPSSSSFSLAAAQQQLHQQLGRGHPPPFSSASSSTASSLSSFPNHQHQQHGASAANGDGGSGGAGGAAGRLHSNASVSISVASASGSDITLPGGMRSPTGNGSVYGPDSATTTTTAGSGGERVRRPGAQQSGHLGPGPGAGSRSVSSASVASTWAASLLGWKNFYGASGSSNPSVVSLARSTHQGEADAKTTGDTGDADGQDGGIAGENDGGTLGLDVAQGPNGAAEGPSESGEKKQAEIGPPTVRRLGAS